MRAAEPTTLITLEPGAGAGGGLKIDHQTDRAYLHADAGGFSFCASFSLAQCEQLSRAFARAAFLIEQHEASLPQAAPVPEVA